MRRIGIAGFQHETNTFSNIPTPLENFLNQSGFYPELLAMPWPKSGPAWRSLVK